MNERIKELRKALHMSQDDFGKMLGITKSGISEIENGRRNVTEQHIKFLSMGELNVNEEWLRTGTGEMFMKVSKDKEISDFLADVQLKNDDSFKKRLVVALSRLKDKDWTDLEKFIDMLSDSKVDTTTNKVDTNKMTPEQYHAELDRQLTLEKKVAEK